MKTCSKLHIAIATLLIVLNSSIVSSQEVDLFVPIIPKSYTANRVYTNLTIDGFASETEWKNADWTDLFIDIEGLQKLKPRFDTRAKILWNHDYIYFLFEMEEPHVSAKIEERDKVIFYDNDIELFLKPYTSATHYAELEINALGTPWDLLLMNAYRSGGPIINDWNMDDLKIGVHVDGSLNNPKDIDSSWTVEVAVPWNSLDELLYGKKHKSLPDPWRMNFSRVEWEFDVVENEYVKSKKEDGSIKRESNWVWTEQGAIDMHRPEHWGYLFFADKDHPAKQHIDEYESARQYLFHLYRKQRHEKRYNGRYLYNLNLLDEKIFKWENDLSQPTIARTNSGFEIEILVGNKRLSVNERGELIELEEESFVFAAWCHGNAKRTDTEWIDLFKKGKEVGISDYFIGADADELKRYISLSKDLNLRIHGWVWTLNRPGDSIAKIHPEWYAVNRAGQNSLEYNPYVGYYQWLSPFSDGARNHIKEKVLEIAEVEGLASLHLDYVRFCDVILGKALQPKYDLEQETELPEFDFGYHPKARTKYKEVFGYDPLDLKNPELSTEWRQFRLNSITSLVNEIADSVHMKGGRLSAAVFPFPEMSRSMVRQDWSSWNLDIALPMIYQNFYEEDLNWIEFATAQGVRELDNSTKLYSGLYLPSLKAPDLKIAIQKAKLGGAQGICLFNFGALKDDHFKVLRELKGK